MLSHSGDRGTIKDCCDEQLLTRLRSSLDAMGLKYVDRAYLDGGTYAGKCQTLVGLSLANRYFPIAPEHSSKAGQ